MIAPLVITIDGPAGSGKSTLGDLLAHRLGYTYFDTGVMYRAVTLAALQAALDLDDDAALAALAGRLDVAISPPTHDDGRQYTVRLDSHDVTWELRSPAVTQHVSLVARHAAVRTELVAQQRIIGLRGEIVMVGRDIGTIVMPDAPLKLYLHTSLAERARRRAVDIAARGDTVDMQAVERDLARRDELDTHVMHPAPDAVLLNNDQLSTQDEVEQVVALWHERLHAASPQPNGHHQAPQ